MNDRTGFVAGVSLATFCLKRDLALRVQSLGFRA